MCVFFKKISAQVVQEAVQRRAIGVFMKHSVLVVFGVMAWIAWGAVQADPGHGGHDSGGSVSVSNDNSAGPSTGRSLNSGSTATSSAAIPSMRGTYPSRIAANGNRKVKAQGNFGTKVFRIGPEDTIRVSVWRNPELNVTAPVRPDGKISVPLIGDVQAGGLTPEQVAEIIKKKLSMYIRSPRVAVILTAMRSHEFISRVRVTGAVRTPKSMPYRQGMTVLDVVLEAGGLNDFASGNRTRLYRKVNGKTVVMKVKLGRILKKGKLETNYDVKPGDIISVPERIF